MKTLVKCGARRCKKLISPKQKCWECGEPHCDEHLKLHPRCQKFKICPKPECWEIHTPWCEIKLRHRGPLEIERELGQGAEYVYVWYDPIHGKYATMRRQKVWPCKIGKSKSAPDVRIVAQGALTAHATVPTIPLAFKTDDCDQLESLIHAALKSAGRHMKGSPGTEWFKTNPTEVKRLYRALERMMRTLKQP
jgi:hypothetical protein